jgi:hypothetical protein
MKMKTTNPSITYFSFGCLLQIYYIFIYENVYIYYGDTMYIGLIIISMFAHIFEIFQIWYEIKFLGWMCRALALRTDINSDAQNKE